MDAPADITRLLHDVRDGAPGAMDRLYPVVYEELRRIAHGRLRREAAMPTLNTTALVHEAYLKLVDPTQVVAKDRTHFFALASRAMRFILVDYARRRTAQKRGGPQQALPLDAVQVAADERAIDLLQLNEALAHLMAANERLGQLVEYKFFGGLTYDEIAAVTGRSVPTLKRDWRRARTWLYDLMQDGA